MPTPAPPFPIPAPTIHVEEPEPATRLPGEDRTQAAEPDPVPAPTIHIEEEGPAHAADDSFRPEPPSDDLSAGESVPPEPPPHDLPADEPLSARPPVRATEPHQLLFSTSKCEVATGKSGRRCAKSATHTRDGQLLCERHADLQEAGEDIRWASADAREGSSKCQSLTKAGKRCPKWAKFSETDRLYCPSHASDEIKARKR